MYSLAPYFPVFVAKAFLAFAVSAHAGPDRSQERLEAAFVLQLGRPAQAEELETWEGLEFESVSQAMGAVAKADEAREVARRAWRDAYGEAASVESSSPGGSYVELLARHVEQLEENDALYREAIRRAYRFVIQREPYEEEIAYWMERPALPYLLLAGGIEDWARRNQPGLMVTAGEPAVSVNCVYLSTRRLSPEVAEEARQAAGLEEGEESRIVAPGAGAAVSVGGIHFVVCGSELL